MKKIILIGGYGYSDIGDESQLTASLINLRKYIPDAQFLVLSDNPEYSSKYHGVETHYSINHFLKFLRFFPLRMTVLLKGFLLLFNARRLRKNRRTFLLKNEEKKFLNDLKSANLLFNIGGGNITSVWCLELYGKCFTYLLCRTFGIPVVLSGQTIGPFRNRLDRYFAKFALNRVNFISLREKISENILNHIGITKPLIMVTADDSTTLPPIDKEKVKKIFSEEKIGEHHPLIGINMIKIGYLPYEKERKARNLLAKIGDYLIAKYNAKIVFIPHSYALSTDERVAASEVLNLMKHKDRVCIISHEYDDRTLKGIIGQMDLAIGFRYHFIVFAVNSQVPSIGIYFDDYYSIKIRGILELVGQEKYAYDLETTSLKDLIRALDNLFSNKELICKKLGERTKELGKLSLFSIKYAKKLLSLKHMNRSLVA